jgi:hypothetical protein
VEGFGRGFIAYARTAMKFRHGIRPKTSSFQLLLPTLENSIKTANSMHRKHVQFSALTMLRIRGQDIGYRFNSSRSLQNR